MSPLFMCDSDSPGSLSAEDCHGNTGFEGEGEEQPAGPRGSKRREKNRDAARKSRKKQTKRADELHEELQSFEQSNLALRKEIATLKKELHFYETTLKRHEPHCNLNTSPCSSDSFTNPSVSDARAFAAPEGIPPPSAGSLSTSKSASQDCKTSNYSSISLPVPRSTPGSSSVGPPSTLFASCFGSVPSSVQLSTHVAPIASPPGLLPNSAQLQAGQLNTPQTSSSYFTAEPFLPKQDSPTTASPDLVPPYSLLEVQNSSAANQAFAVNEPQPHSFQSTSSPSSVNLLCSFYRSPLQNSAPGWFAALPQSDPDPTPAPTFHRKLRHFDQAALNAAPQLSGPTAPGPLTVSQTANSFYAAPAPPLQSHPPPEDPKDLSLSDFLEVNDWILTVTNNF